MSESFPYWERGLKYQRLPRSPSIALVVPLLGTWIEIREILILVIDEPSFPYWERGLKSVSLSDSTCPRKSFPYWERGLKYLALCHHQQKNPSFPYWERGLKYARVMQARHQRQSFPYWERGLKSMEPWRSPRRIVVVPLLGTWIEMNRRAEVLYC